MNIYVQCRRKFIPQFIGPNRCVDASGRPEVPANGRLDQGFPVLLKRCFLSEEIICVIIILRESIGITFCKAKKQILFFPKYVYLGF